LAPPKAQRHARHASQGANAACEAAHAWQWLGHLEDAASLGYMMGIYKNICSILFWVDKKYYTDTS
jgi:hypothetical protein